MNKDAITEKQGVALIVLYSIGISSVLVTAIGAQNDLWISIILSTLIMIPMGLVYGKLSTIIPNKDIFDVIYLCWGKYIGRIIAIAYIWFLVNICMFALRDLGEFFRLTVGPETPMIFPMLVGMLVTIFGIKKGIKVLGRIASFFLIPVSIFIILDNLFLLPEIKLNNLQPILYNGWMPVFKGIFNTISYPLGELVAFTGIFYTLSEKEAKRAYVKGIVLSGIILLVSSAITLLVIGNTVARVYYFPAYVATSRITIGRFFQSVEVLLAFMLTLGGYSNFAVLFLCSAKGISSIFGIDDYRPITFPLGIFILNYSLFIADNTSEFYTFTRNVWPYYAIPFQIVLPIATLVIAKIKIKKNQVQKI